MLIRDAAFLITNLDSEACGSIVRTLRTYLGARATGVTARIALRHGVRTCVTLSDHDPMEGVGTMPWMIGREKLAQDLARGVKAYVTLVMSDRRTSWEQIQTFDRGGRPYSSVDQSAGALDRYAEMSGFRRVLLEDLIDELPGLSWPLAGDAVPTASDLEATAGEIPAEVDRSPHALELQLSSAILEELAALRRKLRAKEPNVVEAVWRIAVGKQLFAAVTGPDGSRLRPFRRAGVLRERKLQAVWSTEPLPSSDARAATLQVPRRVIWEMHELAAHADRPVSWVFERMYLHARGS